MGITRFVSLPLAVLLSALGQIARRQWLAVTLIGLLAFAGSATVGELVGISEPRIHDEFSYLLAADTFAHGRLTNPTHPMWIHFESFHIIQQPTYMSKFPPAQGLALATGEVIAGHPMVGVWISFGLMCAAICWMLYAWAPRHWALFGGFLAVIHPALGMAGYWAQSYWGGAVAATGGALALGGLRRTMRRPCALHTVIMAAGISILANSRPFEGLFVSLPAALALLIWILGPRGPSFRISANTILVPCVIVFSLVGILMGLYNFRVTGTATRLPYQVHEKTYGMAPVFIWQTPGPIPTYHHKVMHDFHKTWAFSIYNRQRSIVGFIRTKVNALAEIGFESMFIFVIPLVGMSRVLFAWTFRDRWARPAMIICVITILGLLIETFPQLHYIAPVASLKYFFVVSAMRFWRSRDKKAGGVVLCLIPLLAVIGLVKWTKQDNAAAWHAQRARLLYELKQGGEKHLVVISYGPEHSSFDEWVYNEADIDAAKVVWAREIDRAEDCKLVQYFKGRRIWSLEVDSAQSIPQLKPYPTNLCQ